MLLLGLKIHRNAVRLGLLGWLCLLGACNLGNPPAGMTIRQGVLDLSQQAWRQLPLLPLTGEWEFCGKELRSPADFAQLPPCPRLEQAPQDWARAFPDQGPGGKGYGTYRLVVRLPPQPAPMMSLLAPWVGSSYRLWINGQEYPGMGKVGTSSETSQAEIRANHIAFLPSGEQLELILQVSNYHYLSGGMIHAWELGTEDKAEQALVARMAFQLAQVFVLFMLVGYALLLFRQRQRDTGMLYLAAFGLLNMGLALWGEGMPIERLFPALPWEWNAKIMVLLKVGLLPSLLLYVQRMFPEAVHEKLNFGGMVSLGLYALVVLMRPASEFIAIFPLLALVSLLLLGSLGSTLRQLRQKKHPLTWPFGVALASCIAGMGLDSLLDLGVIAQPWPRTTSLGGIVFLSILYSHYLSQFARSQVRFEELQKHSGAMQLELSKLKHFKREFVREVSSFLGMPSLHALSVAETVLRQLPLPESPKLQQNLSDFRATHADLKGMQDLIEDYYHLKSGFLELQLDSVLLDTLVKEVYLSAKSQSYFNRIELQLRQEAATPPIWGDAKRLREILSLCLRLAAWTMKEGRIEILLKAPTKTEIELVLQDTRIEAGLESLQKYLDQSDPWETSNAEIWFSGASLYFSRTVLNRFGGRVSIDTPAEGGLAQHFYLPLAQQNQGEQQPQAAASGNAPPRLLLLDNHEDRRQFFKMQLGNGFRWFESGLDDLDWARVEKIQPQLILLSLTSLTPKGLSQIQQIRSRYLGPMLLLVEFQTPGDAMQVLQVGVNDFLLQPVNNEVIIQRMQTLIQQQGKADRGVERWKLFMDSELLEASLREKATLMQCRQIIEAEPTPLVVINSQGKIECHNQRASYLVGGVLEGYSITEVLGFDASQFPSWLSQLQGQQAASWKKMEVKSIFWQLYGKSFATAKETKLLLAMVELQDPPPLADEQLFSLLAQIWGVAAASPPFSTELPPQQPISKEDASRRLLVELMFKSLQAYENATGLERDSLARESGIWSVYEEKDGRVRTQTLDRYLSLATLPANPRVRQVLSTAQFVRDNYPLSAAERDELDRLIKEVQVLVSTSKTEGMAFS